MAHNNLGNALRDQGLLNEAVACYHEALRRQPDYAEAHNNLGIVLQVQGRLDEAVACYHEALRLKPGYAEAHNNLGNVLREQGRLDEAVALPIARRCSSIRATPTRTTTLAAAFQDTGTAGRGGRQLPRSACV